MLISVGSNDADDESAPRKKYPMNSFFCDNTTSRRSLEVTPGTDDQGKVTEFNFRVTDSGYDEPEFKSVTIDAAFARELRDFLNGHFPTEAK